MKPKEPQQNSLPARRAGFHAGRKHPWPATAGVDAGRPTARDRVAERRFAPAPRGLLRGASLLALLPLLLAGGCAVGPDYKRPPVNTPAEWDEPLSGGETAAAASPVVWWKNFHDAGLDSLIDRAVQSNLDLKIAQARVREARARHGVARAGYLPAVNAAGSVERQRQSQNQPVLGAFSIPSDAFTNTVYQAGFDASWELDLFGGKRRATEAAGAEIAAAEFDRRDTLVTLLGEVARNYVDVRGYQRRLAVANENIEAQTKALAITRKRFANGLASDLDVQQAGTLLATTRAEIPTLETALHAAIHRLGVLLGRPPGALLAELSAAAPIPSAPPEVPVGLPSALLLRRPDVRRAERELAAATARIGVAKSDLFPKFSLTGAAGFESVNTGDWFAPGSRFWSFGPTVQWGLFDTVRVRANIRVRNARQEQALAAYERTALTAFEDVENSLVAYANEQTRRGALEEAVASSRRSLELADRLYANGLTDFLHVLDAERSLYQAQDALIQSDRTVSINLIALYKALGGGWETLEKHPPHAAPGKTGDVSSG